MSVVLATQEPEAGGSLVLERLRLQLAMIMPLHYSLADRIRLCLRKNFKSLSNFMVLDYLMFYFQILKDIFRQENKIFL